MLSILFDQWIHFDISRFELPLSGVSAARARARVAAAAAAGIATEFFLEKMCFVAKSRRTATKKIICCFSNCYWCLEDWGKNSLMIMSPMSQCSPTPEPSHLPFARHVLYHHQQLWSQDCCWKSAIAPALGSSMWTSHVVNAWMFFLMLHHSNSLTASPDHGSISLTLCVPPHACPATWTWKFR